MDKKFKNNSLVIIFIIIFIIGFSYTSDIIDKVNDLIDSKQFSKAIRILQENKQKIGIDYYTALSIIYAHTNSDYNSVLKEAKRVFVDSEKNTSKKDRNFSKILYCYGYIEYYVNLNIYNAEVFLKESLAYDQNNEKAMIVLAQLYYDKFETEKSEELLDKTFEILKTKNIVNENFLKIYNQILFDNKRYSKIIKLMKPYLQKYDIVKLFYAKSLAFNSEYIEANKVVREFLSKNNDNLEAYYILGLTYKDSRVKSSEGLELIEKLNEQKNDRYYLKLAQFYEGLGDINMAINYYDKTLSLNKNNDKYYILAITYAIDTGFTSKAINWALEYYNKKPKDFYANLFLAMCYEYQKQFENSKKYYYQAIDIDPTKYEPYVRLAWIVLEQESDFNTCAEILLKGYGNSKDVYYKNRFKKSLKDLLDLESEFRKKYKERTNQDISKGIKQELREQIMKIING
ncbi:MAG: hypothetical protein NZM44_00745 [Candidatus Calescibacterium sp.]|nr:hypothetical protein [Candidatus Calescibacterium sp.]